MQDVRRETGILSDTMQGIGHLGRNMTLAVSAPLAALGFGAVKAASDFDAAMRNINSIAFLTEDQLKALSQRTLEFGATIRSGPQAAAEAMYTVFSAGITDVDTAFNVMKIGSKTAEAGLADLTKTTEGLVAAALTFGDQSPKALQKYSDAITLAVQLGVGSMDTFNTGFANVMGTSAAVGQSFEEMAGMVAFLSQRGIQAGAAGTYLNNALTKLIKPTEDMTSLFDKLGVKSGKELLTTFGGFVPALRAIYKELGANEAEWAKIFNDVRGFKAVSRIFTAFETDGSDAVSSFFDTFDQKMGQGGITMSAWEQQMMSFDAQWDLLTAAVQGFAITVGNILLPVLTPIINGIKDFILRLQAADPVLLKVGVAFAAVVAAAGPLLWIIGSLMSPVGLLLGAVAALGVAFTTNWNGIRDTVTKAITDMLGPMDDLKKGIDVFIQTLFGETPTPTNPGEGVQNGVQPSTIRAPVTFELLPAYDKNFKGIAELAQANNVTVDDILKALGFKTLKEAMGAKPGKYTINFDVELVPNTAKPENPLKSGQRAMWEDAGGIGGEQPDNSIGGRLAAAFDKAWPVIQPALDRMWANIKNWVDKTFLPGIDTAGGGVLDSIAGWFGSANASGDSTGDTPVYNALRDLLNGGLEQASTNFSSWVDDHFPNISTGLQNLINQMVSWITTTGIPTLTRSGGYLVGTLASGIGTALGSLWQTIAGKNPQAGASLGQAKDFVQTSVLQPWQEGFNQAMKDNNVGEQSGGGGFVDSLFTGVAGALATGAGAIFLAKLISSGFPAAISATLGAAMTAARLVFKVGDLVLDGILTVISSQILARLPNTTIFNAVGSGLIDLIAKKTGTGTATAGAFDGIITAIGSGVSGAAGKITAAAPWITTVMGAIGTALSAVAVTIATLGIVIGAVLIAKGLGDLIQKAINDTVMAEPPHINLTVDQEKMAQDWRTQMEGQQVHVPVVPTWGTQGDDAASLIENGPTIPTLPVYIEAKTNENTFADLDAMVTQQLGAEDAPKISIPIDWTWLSQDHPEWDSLLKPPTSDDVKVKLIDPLVANIASNIAIATGSGSVDGTPIANSLVNPIQTAFTTAFGTEGTVTLTWSTFVSSYLTKAATLGLSFLTLGLGANLLKTTFITAFQTMHDKVIQLIDELGAKIASLNSSIKNVGDAVGGAAGTGGVDTGTGITPTAHASGGSAQGWSMVGERGPELAYFGNKGMVVPTRMLREMGGNGGTTVNQVQINGVQDVDGLLFELERRGIRLT